MKILLTNRSLASRTGTEIVARDLALGLAAMGQEPLVFSPEPGPVAGEIRAAGIPVVDRLEDLPEAPDVIHGHHHVETTLAMLRFPAVPAIFVCHDRFAWHDHPPKSGQIRRYVAVDQNCVERLTRECEIPEARVQLIHNAVDTRRFLPRPALPDQPARALIFSNYAAPGTHLEPVRKACSLLGISLDVLGSGAGASSDTPETVLPGYDLVFAKARCALESMAAGNAVILCDTRGLGPLVTMQSAGELRDWNFGMRCLQQRLLPGSIVREILRYNAEDAAAVSSWIRRNANLDTALTAYLKLYREVIAEGARSPVTVSVGEILNQLAARSGALESRLRSSGGFLMPPLPPAAISQISLRAVERIRTMAPGSAVELMTELQNGSNETLASLAPTPVHLSYHWLDADSRQVVVHEGYRTALSANVTPGSVHRQAQTVHAPPNPGRFLLRLTPVQESISWFDHVNPEVSEDLLVKVGTPGDGSSPAAFDLERTTAWTPGLTLLRNASFSNLGFLSGPKPSMLTFVESRRFADEVRRASGVTAVITTPELAPLIPASIGLAVCENPRASFVDIHNHLAASTTFYWDDFPTSIHPTARIHPSTQVPELNVAIGPGVVIGPNVTIEECTILGDRCIVQSGAVLGAEGLQSDRSGIILRDMTHAGGLMVEADSKIFANAVLARGVFREFTRIGPQARVCNGAFVSHNVRVGCRATVGHGAVVNGNCDIGDNAWIGPNATIANCVAIGQGAHVSLGTTVLRAVKPGARVMGSFAADSRKMIRFIAEIENGGKTK